MEKAAEYLIDLGYRDIVIESSHWWEKKSGIQPEYEDTVAVARKNGLPHRLRCHWSWPPSNFIVQHETPISDEEFQAAAAAHGGYVDSEEERRQYATRQQEALDKERRSRIARRELDSRRPTCSNCGARMELRPARFGAAPWFWGCSQFAKRGCRSSLSIGADEWRALEPLVRGRTVTRASC